MFIEIIKMMFEFFKIGLFSFGGGYSTVPFLYFLSQKYTWFSSYDIINILSIASITPGPVGLNMATFAGFRAFGFCGSILSSMSLIFPSYCLCVIFQKYLKKYENSPYFQNIFSFLKPITLSLVLFVGVKILKSSIFCNTILSYKLDKLLLFFILLLLNTKLEKKPIVFLGVSVLYTILTFKII